MYPYFRWAPYGYSYWVRNISDFRGTGYWIRYRDWYWYWFHDGWLFYRDSYGVWYMVNPLYWDRVWYTMYAWYFDSIWYVVYPWYWDGVWYTMYSWYFDGIWYMVYSWYWDRVWYVMYPWRRIFDGHVILYHQRGIIMRRNVWCVLCDEWFPLVGKGKILGWSLVIRRVAWPCSRERPLAIESTRGR